MINECKYRVFKLDNGNLQKSGKREYESKSAVEYFSFSS